MLMVAAGFGDVVIAVVLCIALVPLLIWRWNHKTVPVWKWFSKRPEGGE